MISPLPVKKRYQPKLNRLRRQDEDMTLCIAAISNGWASEEAAIVCYYDFRVQIEHASSDTGSKFRRLSSDWGAMLAGVVPKADRLLDLLAEALEGKDIPASNAVAEIRKVAMAYKRELTDEYTQSVLGMSYEEFRQANQTIPPALYEQVFNEIATAEIGCDVILFNVQYKSPYIFRVSAHGLVDQIRNFCAIGTGAINAEAWLHFRAHTLYDSLEKAVANVYEAARFAAHAPGVGQHGRVRIIDAKNRVLRTDCIEELDFIWKRNGPRKKQSLKGVLDQKLYEQRSWKDMPTRL